MIRLYYDGQCGWCRAGARRLKRLDWLGRLELVDYTTLALHERPVPPDVFDTGMPVRTHDGRVFVGFDGVRHALMHTPAGWLVGWTLYLPGVSHLGRRAYRWIARHRPRDACRIAPRP